MERESFSNGKNFVIAAIAASVGLGNVMRFPGLCAKYGGGAFLTVYLIALIFLGLPLLCAEIALGRKFKKPTPQAFKNLCKPAEAVGWFALANTLLTAIFYAAIIGWLLASALKIFEFCQTAKYHLQGDTVGVIAKNILNFNAQGKVELFPLLTVLTLCGWVIMYFCLKGGASALSKISRFTVFIPIALFAVLAIRGLLYNNSLTALKALFLPNFSAFATPQLWQAALGQAFFSLSALAGVMPAYGSFLPKNAKIFPSALAVAAADLGVSVLASIAFFTTVYGCGLQGAISDSALTTAFSVYPVAISKLFAQNGVVSGIFGVLFYSSLVLIALQSTLSMLEAVVVAVKERFNMPNKSALVCVFLPAAVISLVFCTNYGQLLVGVCDDICNRYAILILGVLECIALIVYGNYHQICSEINANCKKLKMPQKLFTVSLKFLCPTVLFALLFIMLLTTFLTGIPR